MKNIITFFMVLFMLFSSWGVVSYSQGAQYNIKTMTPAIKQSLERRRERFIKIQDFKKQGIIGENNLGYVEVLESSKEAQDIADRENADRKIIYEAIVEQNNLGDALEVVEKVFAQVKRDKAVSGEKIQKEDGTWITKE